jgi:hypothetical protein
MRLLTAISIASLVVSIAAVVFVLGLYAELDKSEPDTPLVKKEHTQELTALIVKILINDHAKELIKSAGITDDNKDEMTEVWEALPAYRCLWQRFWNVADGEFTTSPVVNEASDVMTYNYIKQDDIWLVTAYYYNCKELTTWAIDDNTGEVTYGHPDEK